MSIGVRRWKIAMTFHLKTIETSLDEFEIYAIIEKGEDYIFLDSSKKESTYGRYSIIGANPFLTMKYENHRIYEKWGMTPFVLYEEHEDVFQYLKEKMEQYKVENPTDLPFIGGAIGYFSYDFGCHLENINLITEQVVAVPEAYFVFYDNAIIKDNYADTVSITGLSIREDAEKSINDLIHQIKMGEQKNKKHESSMDVALLTENTPFFKSPFSSKEYKETIEKIRDYIREGHIYIANMTHTFSSHFTKSPLKTYERLRNMNPAPFSAYLPLDGFGILCSSPERFLKVRNGQVQTRPIKGTIPRGKTPQEDVLNQKILENSEKDKSELLMIIDLERNDLSKVCQPGTVKVPELFKTEAYATVFHLVSTVVGTLKSEYTAVDCLKATFPGGSITGAPKIRAMEIIDELERNRRNLYTGSVGYFGFDGNADFNIIIRSILIKDKRAYIGVGGGITWESDAQSEYDETIAKAIVLFKSLEADYDI